MAVDQRFYQSSVPMKLKELVGRLDHHVESVPDMYVSGISTFADAIHGELCFVDNTQYAEDIAGRCDQGVVCLISAAVAAKAGGGAGAIIVDAPRQIFFQLATLMFKPIDDCISNALPKYSVHADAQVHPTAILGDGVAIGARSRIGPYAVIGAGVQIGSGCTIGSAAAIGFALIGNDIEIGSGARIGGAGFGVLPTAEGGRNVPHFGRVLIQDHVRIGANTCIDRGVLGDTVIGENSKIDNLCHIGHNTTLGRNVIMAAFAGISGSVDIGDDVRMGGRVGIVDHVSIGRGAQLGADAAVFTSVPAGETWAGSPARPLRQWQRETVWIKQQTRRRDKS